MTELALADAPVIGPVGPRHDGLDEPHWAALHEARLVLQRCRACARWIWGPRWACPSCLTLEPRWEEVEARGTVFSWTRTWHQFAPQVASHLPYLTVLVELPHAQRVRLLGLLLGDQQRDPVLGEGVVGVVQPPCDATRGAAVLRWRLPLTHDVNDS